MAHYPFEAWYESGTVISFEAPQTWRHVFSSFKLFARCEGSGELYCRGVLVRRTGRNKDCDFSIYPWYVPSPEPDYGLLDINAMYQREQLSYLCEEEVMWDQFLQYGADCFMSDREAQLRESEPEFDPWGSFDWGYDYVF